MGVCETCGGCGQLQIEIDVVEGGFLRKQLAVVICPTCEGGGTDGRKDEDGGDSGGDGYTI